jgi:predicted HicB family RNase H-like nuclease
MDRKYRWQIQDVPADLRRAAKSEAVRQGMTTGAWVAEAIREKVEKTAREGKE